MQLSMTLHPLGSIGPGHWRNPGGHETGQKFGQVPSPTGFGFRFVFGTVGTK
jgi:hypothetical protein